MLLLGGLAGVLLWQISSLLDAYRRVDHSDRVIAHVVTLQSQLLAMQNALRGYVITGDGQMLNAFERAERSLEPGYARLTEQVAADADQLTRVADIRPMLDQWIDYAHYARATAEVVFTPLELISDEGEHHMNVLQAALSGVLAAESSLRDERSLAVRRSAALTVTGGVGLTALLGLLLASIARRQLLAVGTSYGGALAVTSQLTLEAQEREKLLRLITDTLPSLVTYVDADQRYQFNNFAYEAYRGYSRNDLRGRHVREVLGEQDYQRLLPHMQAALAGRHVSFDLVMNFPRTGTREVHCEYLPHVTETGAVAGFIAIVTDVTERNQAQRELAHSEERYRNFIQQSTEGIWRFELTEPIDVTEPVDRQIDLLYERAFLAEANDAMARMYGLDQAGQVIGARLGDLLVRGNPANVAYLRAFVHSGYRLSDGESVERDAQGNERHFLNNLVGFVENGMLVRAWGTQRDVTDQKRAERQRDALLESERALRAEAERAGQMKDEFLSTLSHELRTPLNAILGWAQLLRRPDASEADFKQGLETIERNSRMQAQIIDDLLDMSRIVAGKIRLDVQRVELAKVIESAIDTVSHAAGAKGVALVPHVEAERAAVVMGDPARLQQMVWNLLSNAIKFTPRGGRIDVALRRGESGVEITVADSGIGISPEFLPHVFERFRQADASTTRVHGGLGLGLAIVRQMAEMHGGTVSAHSEGEGKGATFRVELPVEAALVAAEEKSGNGHHPDLGNVLAPVDCDRAALSGVKVLVVDDEPDALELIRRSLADCSADVVTATSARQALDLLAASHLDVLVSDIGMPDHDGYWLIQQLRRHEHQAGVGVRMPAVALTAFARAEDRARALQAGYQIHVAKPVQPAELVAVVASVAGRG